MKKRILSLLLALSLCLTPVWAAEGRSQAGETVARALSQMGYTEASNELTKFGQRFGYPHGYWCDMFVSWCAREAGVSEEIFPSSISCGAHYQMFKAMGQWQNSAVRGGSYLPRQGDLALFRGALSNVIGHVGLVLYTENGFVFTIEGNALTNRLDYPPEQISPLRTNAKDPLDYVTVNQYPLDDVRLYGYATPAYTSREPLDLEGYVDLAAYADLQPQLTALAEAGVMQGTSSHTFSPRNGMARGEFTASIAALCGLSDWDADTPAFADAPPSSPYYSALMAARSAGLIQADSENNFQPERYISGPDAQDIISRALALRGEEDRTFSFGPGDTSYLLTPYTTRIDLAKALYVLMTETRLAETANLETAVFDGAIRLGEEALEWKARTLEGACYVPLALLRERFPELTAAGPSAEELAAGSTEVPEANEPQWTGDAQADGKLAEAFAAAANRAFSRTVTLSLEDRQAELEGFRCGGVLYVPLVPAAELLGAELEAVPAEPAEPAK